MSAKVENVNIAKLLKKQRFIIDETQIGKIIEVEYK